jgi:hypothetical protein
MTGREIARTVDLRAFHGAFGSLIIESSIDSEKLLTNFQMILAVIVINHRVKSPRSSTVHSRKLFLAPLAPSPGSTSSSSSTCSSRCQSLNQSAIRKKFSLSHSFHSDFQSVASPLFSRGKKSAKASAYLTLHLVSFIRKFPLLSEKLSIAARHTRQNGGNTLNLLLPPDSHHTRRGRRKISLLAQ